MNFFLLRYVHATPEPHSTVRGGGGVRNIIFLKSSKGPEILRNLKLFCSRNPGMPFLIISAWNIAYFLWRMCVCVCVPAPVI